MRAVIAGFDLGGTNARAIVFNPADGQILGRARGSSAGHGSAVVTTIVDLLEELRTQCGHAVEAIGLGVAGLAHRSGTVHYSPNMPDLTEFPLGQEVERATGLPVLVGNDATCATLAEYLLGSGRGTDNFALLTLGTGIGSGFVVDGQLLRGASGFAGESGHMVVDLDGPAHHTGQRGAWEYFASGTALGRLGREAAMAGEFPAGIEAAGAVEDITGFHVATAAVDGDGPAERILDNFCREVARGAANLVVVLDVARLTIGGGLSKIGEPLRAGVDRWLNKILVGSEHRPAIEVRLAELGDEAGAVGAALLVAETMNGS